MISLETLAACLVSNEMRCKGHLLGLNGDASDDQEVVTLDSVREKYGAGSEEYKNAAAEMAP